MIFVIQNDLSARIDKKRRYQYYDKRPSFEKSAHFQILTSKV